MLRRLLDVLFWVGAGLYFGGMVALGVIVAPAVFETTKKAHVSMPGIVSPPLEVDRQVGGEIFGVILDRFVYVEVTCLVLLLVGLAGWLFAPGQRVVRRSTWWMLVLWVVLVGMLAYDVGDLRPRVNTLRQTVRDQAAAHAGDAGAEWPARVEFDALHKRSETLGHVKVYTLLVMIVVAALRGTRRRAERDSPHEAMWRTRR